MGYRGQKKRQRGGASEAEGGLEMDGNILFIPSSLPLFRTLSGSRLQQRSTKSRAFIKRWTLAFGSICLAADHAPAGDAAQRGDGWSGVVMFAQTPSSNPVPLRYRKKKKENTHKTLQVAPLLPSDSTQVLRALR